MMKKLDYRSDLQGLRAIAILLIIVAHSSFDLFQGGFIGVDIFFILSGYLITGLIQKEIDQTNKFYFIGFFARRLKRLLPALTFMLLIVFFIAYFTFSEFELYSQLASTKYAITWTSNLFFAFREIDYFNELTTNDLFLHTWSLGVEEQFYLFWPIVIILIFKLEKILKLSYNFSLIVILIISLTLSIYWTKIEPMSAFYLMPSRIWQFTIGALIYYYFGSKNKLIHLKETHAKALQYIGFISIAGCAVFFTNHMTYPGYWAIIPSVGAAFIIIAGLHIKNNVISSTPFVWLGNHSYSLYLWHWPIFKLGFVFGYSGQIIPVILMVTLSLGISIFSLVVIEKPFWKGKMSHAKPSLILTTSILTMLIVIFFIIPTLKQSNLTYTQIPGYNKWKADIPIIYDLKCDDWFTKSEIKKCEFGNKQASNTIVLFGDSILAQWFSILPKTFKNPQWKIIVMIKSACPLVDIDYFYPRIGKIYQVCMDWRNSVLDELDKIKPDIVFMGNAATYEFSERQWKEGSIQIVDRVQKAAKHVYIIPGTPNLSFDGPICLARNSPTNDFKYPSSCVEKNRDKLIQPIVKLLENITKQYSNVDFLNLNDQVCPKGLCSAINSENIVVFRDKEHLTNSFVEYYIKDVQSRLEINGLVY